MNDIRGILNWVWFDLCRDQVPVDFKQVDAYVHQYKGSSARYNNTVGYISDYLCIALTRNIYLGKGFDYL